MNYLTDSPDNQNIRLGDKCVIYISEYNKYILKIDDASELQTKFGVLKGLDLIGHPYGVRFDCKKGWILPLRLTPELWTQLLPHRTQILYQADISLILLQLDIKPGSIVVESGTGSGSLSHSILRACLPDGFLHTFDINESRVADAQEEFAEHGFKSNVQVYNRNVCESGFPESLVGKADACMLDLPQTWLAIEHAYQVLKPSGSRLCTFSPCVEQVKNNVAKMTQLKMKDIITVECLKRPYNVKEKQLRLWDPETVQKLVAAEELRFSIKRARLEDGDNQPKSSTQPAQPSFNLNTLPTKTHTYCELREGAPTHSGYLTFASRRP